MSDPSTAYQEVPDYQEISSDEGITNLEKCILNGACSQRDRLVTDWCCLVDLLLEAEAEGTARVRVRGEI